LEIKSVQKTVEALIAEAERTSAPRVDRDLAGLLNLRQIGFRELVLLISVGRLLDATYQPSVDFYSISPRSFWEKGIRPILEEHGLPCTQSPALNLAKATTALDDIWAKNRRPPEAGAAVAKIASRLDRNDYARRSAIVVLNHLLTTAAEIRNLAVDLDPTADVGFLASLAMELIENVPDRGNTPQRVVGYLVEKMASSLNVRVEGHRESAATTNRTSKKPGDIAEYLEGQLLRVYEVTVKPVTLQRLSEATSSLRAYHENVGTKVDEVLVLCRAEDVGVEVEKPSLEIRGYFGSVDHGGVVYHLINIVEWIGQALLRLTPGERMGFLAELEAYVDHENTPLEVKRYWQARHQRVDINER
jgi:hypothetical protein